MHRQATEQTPQTIQEVKATNNYIKAGSHAIAYARVGERLPYTDGPIVSKKLFIDISTRELVYEFYRIKNKEAKVYVIF